MISICYSLCGEIGELRSVTGTGEIMRFSFSPDVVGRLLLGDRATEVKGGACEINTRSLTVGVHTPRLVCNSRSIALEPISVERGRVSAAPTPDTTLRAALVRLEDAEKTIKKLEERIAELTVMIKGNGLFG